MSTSLLYHGFGIIGYRYVHTRYEGGKVIFRVRQDRDNLMYPCCNSYDVKKRGSFFRRFRGVPIGSKAVVIEMPVQRIECDECGVVRQVNNWVCR